MAKRWKATDKIGLKEPVGRRLFDEPALRGATKQPAYNGIKISHFKDDEISLDRLGASGVDRKVVNYLKPRVETQRVSRKAKNFDGWAVVRATEFIKARNGQNFDVVVSKISPPDPDENEYHAHLRRPEEVERQLWPFLIRETFQKYGEHHAIPQKAPENWAQRLRRRMKAALKSIWPY